MVGEPIPKAILKKINQKRAEKGLGSYEEDEKKRKKRENKPTTDVGIFLLYFVVIPLRHFIWFFLQTTIEICLVFGSHIHIWSSQNPDDITFLGRGSIKPY